MLVVDDHGDVLETERRLLTEFGAQVTTANSGGAALQLLETEEFDVLLSDWGMPGMDGYQLIKFVRSSNEPRIAQMAAAAVSAFVRPEDSVRALEAGYQLYLKKPFSPSALAGAVATLVGR